MINLRKHWKVVADDQTQAPDPNQQPDDPNSMQTLVDGTAQKLCQRLWQGYVSTDMTNFPNFMLQLDQITTQFVQALPIPVNPEDLEDATFDDSDESLPSIGPVGDQADVE